MMVRDAAHLGLLTDLYQLTMAAGYLSSGMAEREAAFHLFFRKNPFDGGYAVACGLEQALELVESFRYSAADLDYLAGLTGNDGRPLLAPHFLRFLDDLVLSIDLDAVPEGTVVFPHEPLLRVRGPLAQCQLLETGLLTILNFQTLIATKASRIARAANGDPVLEFGLRRAQGVDGGLSASRAAYIGGCSGTSNVLAGRRFGIPLKGTHAHSWVMSFDDESEAFEAWAAASPNNCIFLVDTYDSIAGIHRAIQAGERLRQQGFEMIGIRLDSGDLVELSQQARRLLDAAGFPDASVVASNDLDELRINELKAAGAAINVWGVGTRLATAHGESALGGVYKLTAIRDLQGTWQPKLKLSENPSKMSNPGLQQVRRYHLRGTFVGDVIYDEEKGLSEPCRWVDGDGQEHQVSPQADSLDLLEPVLRHGQRIAEVDDIGLEIGTLRARALTQLDALDPAITRLEQTAVYPVGLDTRLDRLKKDLIMEVRSKL